MNFIDKVKNGEFTEDITECIDLESKSDDFVNERLDVADKWKREINKRKVDLFLESFDYFNQELINRGYEDKEERLRIAKLYF